ncbi:hypothetical protein RFI_39672 [Reticulomyxa filosa]|uniref:Uncharacterized protein n=1 Tax=Reticulomyxa filosa TaxID=46433 RepID=X6LAW0_RETFI|nr:hypothetical protein RFI_39672 [Reticulomyxa filosa]|eukprot:ETN97854.1 hypothetical protein RFI_39672 [Reticulomyxa filosa]
MQERIALFQSTAKQRLDTIICVTMITTKHTMRIAKKKQQQNNVAAYFIIKGIERITLHNLYIYFRVICVHLEPIICAFNLLWLVQQQHALQYIESK